MIKKSFLVVTFVFISVFYCFSFGQKEDEGMIKITGVYSVYGTEPHTYICIVTEDGHIYYVHPDDQKQVRDLDRYKFIFSVKFIEGPPVSFDAAFHKDGTVRVLSWKKEK